MLPDSRAVVATGTDRQAYVTSTASQSPLAKVSTIPVVPAASESHPGLGGAWLFLRTCEAAEGLIVSTTGSSPWKPAGEKKNPSPLCPPTSRTVLVTHTDGLLLNQTFDNRKIVLSVGRCSKTSSSTRSTGRDVLHRCS